MWTDIEHDAVVAELEGEILALQSRVEMLGALCAELVAAQSQLPPAVRARTFHKEGRP